MPVSRSITTGRPLVGRSSGDGQTWGGFFFVHRWDRAESRCGWDRSAEFVKSLWNLLIKNCKLLLVFEFSADRLFWLWTGSVSAQSVKKARLMGRKCREMPLWSCLDRFQSSLVRVAHRDSPAQFLSFTRRIQQRIEKKMCRNESDKCRVLVRYG